MLNTNNEITKKINLLDSYTEIYNRFYNNDILIHESIIRLDYRDYVCSVETICSLLNYHAPFYQLKIVVIMYKQYFDDFYSWYAEQSLLELERLKHVLKEKKDLLLDKRKEFDYIAQKYEKSHDTVNALAKANKDIQQLLTIQDEKLVPLKKTKSIKFEEIYFYFIFVEMKEKKFNELSNLILKILRIKPVDDQSLIKVKEYFDIHFEKLYGQTIAERLNNIENLRNEINDVDEQSHHFTISYKYLQACYITNMSLLNKLLPRIKEQNLTKQAAFFSRFFLFNSSSISQNGEKNRILVSDRSSALLAHSIKKPTLATQVNAKLI